jgi:hypothetical protein
MPRLIDASELEALAADLLAAPARVIPALVPTANKAGVNMKRSLRKAASGHKGLPRLPASIEYEVDVAPTNVTVNAGWLHPTGQGHLENIAVYGTSRTAPVVNIVPPLTDEVPRFMQYVARAAAEAL